MPVEIEDVISFLENQQLKYNVFMESKKILTSFATRNYTNEKGEHHLIIIIALEENGEFFKIFAPKCYVYADEEFKKEVFQTLLMITWRSKMLTFEYDATDGEICASVEFPIEDSTLTQKQFLRAIFALVHVIDRYHSVIHKAITEGEVDFSGMEKGMLTMEMFQDLIHGLGQGLDLDSLVVQQNAPPTIEELEEKDSVDDDSDEFI
jgi:hypothetical protein